MKKAIAILAVIAAICIFGLAGAATRAAVDPGADTVVIKNIKATDSADIVGTIA